MRIDLYKLIHKAQRQRLFELSIKIGKTDFSEPNSSLAVKSELKKMISHLQHHSENEETFIHPLYHIAKDKLAALDSQHEKIETLLVEIEKIINDEQSICRLYPVFNQFIAMYLQHTAEEERLQEEILWRHYRDEELAAVMTKFQQSLTSQEVLNNIEFMLPCLSVSESIKLLKKMPSTMSQQILQRAPALLQEAYSRHELEMVRDALQK